MRALIKPTFVVNTNSKLIHFIRSIEAKEPELAKQMVREIYDLARLSQREMEPEALSDFIARSNSVLRRSQPSSAFNARRTCRSR